MFDVIRRLLTRYWLLLPLLILAVVLLDRVEQPDLIETEETLDMRQTQSDYYLSEFRTRRFGPDGHIEYIIDGNSLAHYPADDHSKIIEPRLELRRNNELWLVESNSGRFDPEPNLFTLDGDVNVRRVLPGSDLATIIINTPSLRIGTKTNVVETEEQVNIIAPTWNLQAKGLRTAIDQGELSLLSQVVGRYEVPEPTQEQ